VHLRAILFSRSQTTVWSGRSVSVFLCRRTDRQELLRTDMKAELSIEYSGNGRSDGTVIVGVHPGKLPKVK
jgi:hypothetical protein